MPHFISGRKAEWENSASNSNRLIQKMLAKPIARSRFRMLRRNWLTHRQASRNCRQKRAMWNGPTFLGRCIFDASQPTTRASKKSR